MLKVTNLKIEFSELLFENINFKLGNKEKVGLIGLNGSGKSTLLKSILGSVEPDEGQIAIVEEKLGYLPQEFDLDENLFVGEYLESLVPDHSTDMWKIKLILSQLGIKLTDSETTEAAGSMHALNYYSKISTISEGERLKLYLCKLLIEESTILLLDEPTNHLDINGIKWLEKFLQKFDGIVIIISHDRLLLNNLVEQIFEIDENTLHIFHGNYDHYVEQKKEWIDRRDKEYTLQEKKRKKFDEMLTMVRKHSSGKKQSSKLKAIKTRIKREIETNEKTKYKEKNLAGINMEGSVHKNKTVLSIKDLSFSYGKKTIIKKSSFELYGQDKAWFYGANGIGKSTLIKLIIGELIPESGSVKIGENVRWKYFSQNQSHLPYDLTVREYVMKFGKIEFQKSFGILERFLFSKHLQNYKLLDLSPGQRARLSFAVFSMDENDLLILDEPTNHLDIRTKEVIENALFEYNGTILLIAHDRYFVEQVGINRMFSLKNGVVVER